jgi:hypothetical protein
LNTEHVYPPSGKPDPTKEKNEYTLVAAAVITIIVSCERGK